MTMDFLFSNVITYAKKKKLVGWKHRSTLLWLKLVTVPNLKLIVYAVTNIRLLASSAPQKIYVRKSPNFVGLMPR